MATAAAASLEDAEVRKIATHMTHDPNTAKRCYQHLKTKETAVGSYVVMAGVMAAPGSKGEASATTEEPDVPQPAEIEEQGPEQPPPKKKRKIFTNEQADNIMQYFELSATSKSPSLTKCREFLHSEEGRSMAAERNEKHIQDKATSIIRAMARKGT